MPLQTGSKKEVIQSNIQELIAAGKTHSQAVAIAYRFAGIDNKTNKRREKLVKEFAKKVSNADKSE